MGKKRKQGSALRARKRANLAAEELVEQTIKKQEDDKLEAKDDSELFVLDSTPDIAVNGLTKSKKKKSPDTKESSSFLDLKQGKKNRISAREERQIRKIVENKSKEDVVSYANATHERTKQRKREKRIAGSAKASYDLWDDDVPQNKDTKVIHVTSGVKSMGGTAPIHFKAVTKTSLRKDVQQPATFSKNSMRAREKTKARAKKSVKVEPAQPGQSYRPDGEQHQDAIGEALSIELRRKEAVDYLNAPLSSGLKAETMALIVGSSDEESSDDEEMEESERRPVKKKEKMTRAQRNRQKRAKVRQQELEGRREKKQFMHQVFESKKTSKQLKKVESEQGVKREHLKGLLDEKNAKPIGVNIFGARAEIDPINAPSLPVALSEELKGGGLRRVKPKGSLLTDRVESLISRNMANRKVTNIKQRNHGKRRMKGGKGRDFILA
eukprot:CAMPEP_0194073294 /NCGR_PEP_ID=MMETSP0149-20130528/773_1 /TAXON_ID=122233 /ORGANISM="Chaetoceros debilis, Strain MM31A-1" /LENGTH=438 /DNA_ID=CAMNT_0038753299 /DNA_START=84 /DNA_END=1400 /DNA_ORIENTATION=-